MILIEFGLFQGLSHRMRPAYHCMWFHEHPWTDKYDPLRDRISQFTFKLICKTGYWRKCFETSSPWSVMAIPANRLVVISLVLGPWFRGRCKKSLKCSASINEDICSERNPTESLRVYSSFRNVSGAEQGGDLRHHVARPQWRGI